MLHIIVKQKKQTQQVVVEIFVWNMKEVCFIVIFIIIWKFLYVQFDLKLNWSVKLVNTYWGFLQINWDNVFRKENSHPGTATPLTPPPPVRGRGRGQSPSLPRQVRQCPGSLPPLRKVSARNQPPCWRSSETTPCSSSFKASSGVHCTLNALVGPTSDPKVNAFYKFH